MLRYLFASTPPAGRPIQEPEHEAPVFKIALDRAAGRLPDDIAQAHKSLVDWREHMNALRLEGWQVCLPSHEIETRERNAELLPGSAAL